MMTTNPIDTGTVLSQAQAPVDNEQIVLEFQKVGDLFQEGISLIKAQGEALYLSFSHLVDRMSKVEKGQTDNLAKSEQHASARTKEILDLSRRIEALEAKKESLTAELTRRAEAQAKIQQELQEVKRMKEVHSKTFADGKEKSAKAKMSCEKNLLGLDQNVKAVNVQVDQTHQRANELQKEIDLRQNEVNNLVNRHTGHSHSFSYNLGGGGIPGGSTSGPNK